MGECSGLECSASSINFFFMESGMFFKIFKWSNSPSPRRFCNSKAVSRVLSSNANFGSLTRLPLFRSAKKSACVGSSPTKASKSSLGPSTPVSTCRVRSKFKAASVLLSSLKSTNSPQPKCRRPPALCCLTHPRSRSLKIFQSQPTSKL